MFSKCKRWISVVAAIVVLIALFLSGCQQKPVVDTAETKGYSTEETTATTEIPEDGDILWIVTDEDSGMNPLVETMIMQFQQEHPEISIKLQILPTDDHIANDDSFIEPRDIMLQQLRPAIMAGKGPDVYLFPTYHTWHKKLFEDVNLAIRNGLFEDISVFYDADVELGKENLITGVMDAGVYEGGRYVLPLRYELPVAYVDVKQFEAAGGSMDVLEGGILNLYQHVLNTGSRELAIGAYTSEKAMADFSSNFLGQIIDYDAHEVPVTAEELIPFLESLQQVRAMAKPDPASWEIIKYRFPNVIFELFDSMVFWTDYEPMYIGTLQDLLDNSAYSKLTGTEIAAIPVASAKGKVTADVTYYGAVGYGCDEPELAYEFLRLFLTEQGQWTENRDSCEAVHYNGWPVRTDGDVPLLWERRQQELAAAGREANPAWDDETRSKQRALREQILEELTITAEDLVLVSSEVDEAQFSIALEHDLFDDVIFALNEDITSAATDADTNALVEVWLKELEWHLAEG